MHIFFSHSAKNITIKTYNNVTTVSNEVRRSLSINKQKATRTGKPRNKDGMTTDSVVIVSYTLSDSIPIKISTRQCRRIFLYSKSAKMSMTKS